MKIIDVIFDGIAYLIHPEKPRGFFKNAVFPTDHSAAEVSAALDKAAAANPAFENWRTSIVDLMKLSHPDDPDGFASFDNRAEVAMDAKISNYTGTAEQNVALHAYVFKALQQRGIPLPEA